MVSRMNDPDNPGSTSADTAIAAESSTTTGFVPTSPGGMLTTTKVSTAAAAPRPQSNGRHRGAVPPVGASPADVGACAANENGTHSDASTRPKNSARIGTGCSAISPSITPATRMTAANIPTSRGNTTRQWTRRNSPAAEGWPRRVTALTIPESRCPAEVITLS